jgi:hypothetical protein
MKIHLLLAAAILAAAPSAGACAQGLLDQQLGPPAATAPATQPAGAAPKPQAAQPDLPKPGGDIISPDAAKKVDDDELLRQLLDPNAKPDPDAVKRRLKDMVTRMDDAATLLAKKKDPGEVTQETQRRIISDLDVMIELARQQQQSSSSSSSSQQQQPGQQRQPQQNNGQSGSNSGGGSQAATGDNLPRGGYADPTTTDIHNRDPANWGGLPPRDRDQISHGANEEYLSAYKDMIDRYYQALAEMGRTRTH